MRRMNENAETSIYCSSPHQKSLKKSYRANLLTLVTA